MNNNKCFDAWCSVNNKMMCSISAAFLFLTLSILFAATIGMPTSDEMDDESNNDIITARQQQDAAQVWNILIRLFA